MPGAITKRTRTAKVVPATSKRGAAILSNFARVSKPQQVLSKDLAAKTVATTTPTKKSSAATARVEPTDIKISCSKKRKAPVQDENTCPINEDNPQGENTPAPSIPVARSSKRRQLGTIQNNVQRPQTPRGPAVDADLFGTLERLKLQSSPSAAKRAATPSNNLPQELLDLINLHTSFTKALAIHHVHNGTGSPVDVAALCPSITQAWGKRKVVLEDIRRCIGVMGAMGAAKSLLSDMPFRLVDYGRGKVCIELNEQAPRILNEPKMNQTFDASLRQLWSSAVSKTKTAPDARRFVAGLPRAPLIVCESIVKASAVLGKGQRTLDELRQGIQLRKQQEEAERQARKNLQVEGAATASAGADAPKMSLIDRIRYREALKSQQGAVAPLTPEQLQRRAALSRVGDVAAVVAMLITATAMGQKRVSYSMPAILTKLKDSLQVPISREEGQACVKLLAAEVAPQWIKVVTIGGRDNVVVLPDFALSKSAIQDRVRVLSG